MSFAGKTVVVTGAGSGIGRATALAFSREGARVCGCDVDPSRLDALAAELGERALVIRQVDVADRAQMARFAAEVHQAVPAVDVLVNNAGVVHAGAFVETRLEDWDWLLGINLRGVIHGCHFFVPPMVRRKSGHVINMSSIHGLTPIPNASLYVTSKAAVLGFSQSLRAELEPHKIGVTAICPGLVATQMAADGRHVDSLRAYKAASVEKFKKGLAPEVVAAAILAAVRENPPLRTVGRNAWVMYQLHRLAPRPMQRLTAKLRQRRRAAEMRARQAQAQGPGPGPARG